MNGVQVEQSKLVVVSAAFVKYLIIGLDHVTVISMRSAMGHVLLLCCGAYVAVSGLMTAGSNGVRENTSRSIGSKWLSGLVG